MVNYESMTRDELLTAVRELDAKLGRAESKERVTATEGEFASWQYERELFFERSPYPMLIHDRETLQFLQANDAALKLYGYSSAEFLRMKRFEIRTSNNLVKVWEMQQQPTGYMHYRGLSSHRKKSGALFDAEIFSQDIIFKGINARVSLIIDVTERERTLAELQRRQQEFSALAENAPDIIARFDRDFRHVYVNCAVSAITGHPPEFFLGKTNAELGMPEGCVALWHGAMERAFETGRQQEIEFEYPATSGPKYFNTRVVPELDARGCVATVLAIAHDITERRRAEKALEKSEAKYRRLVETSRDLIWSADADGRVTFVNQAVKQIYGYEPEEMVGRRLAEMLDPSHANNGRSFFQEILGSDRSVPDHEYRYLRKDGTSVVLSSDAAVLRDDCGKVVGVTGVSKDVTSQRQSEQALRESEERFRLLAENIRHVFWITAPTGDKFLYVSPAYEEIWCASRDELYRDASAWMDNIHPADLPLVRENCKKIVNGEETGIEYRLVHPAGSTRWIWDRSFVMTTGDGRKLSCGIAEDITERKQLETERLQREIEQRATLVREVHHRIKNHLQGIAGLLRHKVKGNISLMPLVESAVAELQSVAAVFGLQPDLINGHAELRAMLDAIAASVQGVTGGRIEVDYGIAGVEHVLIAETEKVPLALVLNELIFNALKHSAGCHAGKNARIAISKSADSLRITVINKGGLPAGFNFAQGRGTGSGLDLVRSLLPPKISTLSFAQADGVVNTVLTLVPPSISMNAVVSSTSARRAFDEVTV